MYKEALCSFYKFIIIYHHCKKEIYEIWRIFEGERGGVRNPSILLPGPGKFRISGEEDSGEDGGEMQNHNYTNAKSDWNHLKLNKIKIEWTK